MTRDIEQDVASANQHYYSLRRARFKMERKAAIARTDSERAERELNEAIEVFASSDYGNLTLEEIASVGGKIQRRAANLIAAEKLPDLKRRELEAGRKLQALQRERNSE